MSRDSDTRSTGRLGAVSRAAGDITVERDLPLVTELLPALSPWQAFLSLRRLGGALFLDSAMEHPAVGRYSFVTADPFDEIHVAAAPGDSPRRQDPFGRVEEMLRRYRTPALPALPPFQGGAAGLLGYGLGAYLEDLPAGGPSPFGVPDLSLGFYDWVLAFDHRRGKSWIISQGFPETGSPARRLRARERAALVRETLESQMVPDPGGQLRVEAPDLRPETFQVALHPVPGSPGILSDFSRQGYLEALRRIIDHIHAGDIFQANLSQLLLHRQSMSPVELYRRLRERNPAPFAAYYEPRSAGFVLASASPERFLRLSPDGHVETRPIKGTRRRRPVSEEDFYVREELRQSPKDRSENVMIVDLLRNDLSRVCRPGSVIVPELFSVETYASVHHLVSVVEGELRSGLGPVDLLRAAFPGGSITGAPKIRAMEIIAALEPHRRDAYCGSLGYLAFSGAMDTSILIRTVTAAGGWFQFAVGGGVVARSSPEREYEETLDKARGVLWALS